MYIQSQSIFLNCRIISYTYIVAMQGITKSIVDYVQDCTIVNNIYILRHLANFDHVFTNDVTLEVVTTAHNYTK